MKAIMMNRAGGTEVLQVVDRPDPIPRPGQALVEVAAAGVNFMDTGGRRGQFWTEMALPRGLGVEGVGRVLAVGDEVHSVQPGQRVAWVYAPGRRSHRRCGNDAGTDRHADMESRTTTGKLLLIPSLGSQ